MFLCRAFLSSYLTVLSQRATRRRGRAHESEIATATSVPAFGCAGELIKMAANAALALEGRAVRSMQGAQRSCPQEDRPGRSGVHNVKGVWSAHKPNSIEKEKRWRLRVPHRRRARRRLAGGNNEATGAAEHPGPLAGVNGVQRGPLQVQLRPSPESASSKTQVQFSPISLSFLFLPPALAQRAIDNSELLH